MFIREWGTGDKTALLIHGLASSSLTWEPLAQDLVSQGYRVLAPDLHGHGQSKRLPHYSVKRWSLAIHSHIPQADIIIGHSLGALIASNLHTFMDPTKTFLIDPVFRLPGPGFLKVTQELFRRSMLLHFKEGNPKLTDLARIQLSQWDTKTVQALRVNPIEVKDFLHSAKETFIYRCKGSYIAPLKLIAKHGLTSAITVPNSGHNIHQDNYPALRANIFSALSLT